MIDSDSCVVSKAFANASTESTVANSFARFDTHVIVFHFLCVDITKLVHLKSYSVITLSFGFGIDFVNISLVFNEDSDSFFELFVVHGRSVVFADEVGVLAD